MKQEIIINSGDLRITFDAVHGVTPANVALKNYDGDYETVIDGNKSSFTIQQCNGSKFHAVWLGEPAVSQLDDYTQVAFEEVGFADENGKVLPDLTAAFTYDFYDDGTMFSSLYFIVMSDRYKYQDLKLVMGTDMQRFEDVRWAVLHRLESIDGAMIQALGPQRYLERGMAMDCNEVVPLVSFNGFRTGAESIYVEFFMEGGATLSNKRDESTSAIRWENGSPQMEWNFQSVPAVKPQVTMQLRNFWGWIIKNPPRVRHNPPFTMYHYLDNSVRYPGEEELKAMKDSGCDVLIIHENWRHDIQNNGIPFNKSEFQNVVRIAHELGIRVAVYIRGNEFSAVDAVCPWFDRYLQKDFDGFYMDYGSPVSRHLGANEYFAHGRTYFKGHYLLYKKLRERVGKNGLIFSHTGPSYSAMSSALLDGYVSGEGERGMLVRSRKHHEYFSMSAASLGTMWTAAFPEYSTSQMVPFLAAAGQYPHNPLGEQFPSSSLAHPREPGINDKVFRPLWRLWSMFKDEHDLNICNDYNSRAVFPVDPDCGHSLLITADGKRALYIVSNFAKTEKTFDVTPDWSRSGFDISGKKCWLLTPSIKEPGNETEYTNQKLTVTLDGESCAAFYFDGGDTDFTAYRKPYHQPCASGKLFLEHQNEQKRLRENPPCWNEVILTAAIPPQTAFGYEDSMLLDLYDNDSFVVEFDENGNSRDLAKIVRADGKSLFSGDTSVPIDLKKLLTPGRHHLGIRATHCGEPFYSFFNLYLSNDKGESYEIVFRNELEPDRAFLHFDVLI